MIALCIITYLVVGFLLSMLGTFLFKRAGEWDDDWKVFMGFCIILWPCHIILFIVSAIVGGLSAFYDWFSDCIKEKDKEE